MQPVLALLAGLSLTQALKDGQAITPPMGFNSYMSSYSGADGLEAIADFLVASGLRDGGYVYVNTDEGWETSSRDGDGRLQWKGDAYPDGIANFTAALHAKGLKFGIYGAASGVTCGTNPGQLYHEDIDAQTFADWGVDLLKSYALDASVRFGAMRDALNRTGRAIVLSIEPFSIAPDAAQSSEVSHLWRTGQDIAKDWGSILDRADKADQWAPLAGPGGWNDPDMICVQDELALGENRAYFGLWSVAKAPLLLSADLPDLDAAVIDIVNATEVIAVNQDPLGIAGRKLAVDGEPLPWLVGLSDCGSTQPSYARGFGNMGDVAGWDVEEATAGNYTLRSRATDRCLATTGADGRDRSKAGSDAVVLLPCDDSDASQRWSFDMGLHTVTALTNAGTGQALAVANSSLLSELWSGDAVAAPGAAYGLSGLVMVAPADQADCTGRDCQNYLPSQMWYYSPAEGLLRHADYVASMNHHLDGDGYHLTDKQPTYRHHCLAHALATDNLGTATGQTEVVGGAVVNLSTPAEELCTSGCLSTPAEEFFTTQVWGGPLAGDAFVLALLNRGSDAANITASFSLLETDGSFVVRDLWAEEDLGTFSDAFSATVDSHDLGVYRLTRT